jgi:hypothetical protein
VSSQPVGEPVWLLTGQKLPIDLLNQMW